MDVPWFCQQRMNLATTDSLAWTQREREGERERDEIRCKMDRYANMFSKICVCHHFFVFEERFAQKLSGKIRMLQLHRHPPKLHPRKLGRRWRSEGDTGCIHSILRLLCSFGFWFWNWHGICVVAGNLPAQRDPALDHYNYFSLVPANIVRKVCLGGRFNYERLCPLRQRLVISCETKERLTCSHYCIPCAQVSQFCLCLRARIAQCLSRSSLFLWCYEGLYIPYCFNIYTIKFYAGCHIVARAGHWSLGRRICYRRQQYSFVFHRWHGPMMNWRQWLHENSGPLLAWTYTDRIGNSS